MQAGGDFEATTSLGWSVRTLSAEGASHTALAPIEGLEVGPPVGRGAYGRVYRGKYFGETVAIKVMALYSQKGVSSIQKQQAMMLYLVNIED